MKKIKRWLKDYFSPENDMDIAAIGSALNDPGVRTRWLSEMLEAIRQMNIEVDRRLLLGADYQFADLCARRKAYKDILEAILTARRTEQTQVVRHNPKEEAPFVNLDRVTV